jgi:hypothetical protein
MTPLLDIAGRRADLALPADVFTAGDPARGPA